MGYGVVLSIYSLPSLFAAGLNLFYVLIQMTNGNWVLVIIHILMALMMLLLFKTFYIVKIPRWVQDEFDEIKERVNLNGRE